MLSPCDYAEPLIPVHQQDMAKQPQEQPQLLEKCLWDYALPRSRREPPGSWAPVGNFLAGGGGGFQRTLECLPEGWECWKRSQMCAKCEQMFETCSGIWPHIWKVSLNIPRYTARYSTNPPKRLAKCSKNLVKHFKVHSQAFTKTLEGLAEWSKSVLQMLGQKPPSNLK